MATSRTQRGQTAATGARRRYETPGSAAKPVAGLLWCGDLAFTLFRGGTEPMGYVGKCVHGIVDGTQPTNFLDKFLDGGGAAQMISSVFSLPDNAFKVLMHTNTGSYRVRFLDDGRDHTPGMPFVRDRDADHSPNATSSFNGVSRFSWITRERAADVLAAKPTDLSPAAFQNVYKHVWDKNHGLADATTETKPSKGG